MSEPIDIPTPNQEGGKAIQVAGDVVSQYEEPPFIGLEVASTVAGLTADGSRGFGGQFGPKLMVANLQMAGQQAAYLQMENRRLLGQIDVLREQLAQVKIENAQLSTTITNERGSKNLRAFGIVVGTGILNFGINQVRNNTDNQELGTGIVLSVVGGLLLCLSWLSGPQGVKK